MGTLYYQSTGAATNSGSTDQDAADLSGTAATVAASVVTLDGSPDLSGIVTSGATQSTIYIADATNSNMKIFWITAYDDVAKTVTVSVAPTGVTSSVWAIGGRNSALPTLVNVVRAGDTCYVNDNYTSATAPIVVRASGNTTSGFVKIVGKAGPYPIVTCSGASVITAAATGYNGAWIEHLELKQTGGSARVINAFAWVIDCKITTGSGDYGIVPAVNGGVVFGCEVSVATDGIGLTASTAAIANYVHDCAGDGIVVTAAANPGTIVRGNLIEGCSGRGIYFIGAPATTLNVTYQVHDNTIYGCGDSGIEATDADYALWLMNNIVVDNGNAAGEFNVELLGEAAVVSRYNLYNADGGLGGSNLSGLTAHSTDLTSAPLFVSATDWRLQSGSPCKAAAFPGQLLGAGSGGLGYLDMGALQREEPSAAVNPIITTVRRIM